MTQNHNHHFVRDDEDTITICPILLGLIYANDRNLETFVENIEKQIDEMSQNYGNAVRGYEMEENITIEGLGQELNDDPAYKSQAIETVTGMEASKGQLILQSFGFMAGESLMIFSWDRENKKSELQVALHKEVPELSLAAYVGRNLSEFMDWQVLSGIDCLIKETTIKDKVAVLICDAPALVKAKYADGSIVNGK